MQTIFQVVNLKTTNHHPQWAIEKIQNKLQTDSSIQFRTPLKLNQRIERELADQAEEGEPLIMLQERQRIKRMTILSVHILLRIFNTIIEEEGDPIEVIEVEAEVVEVSTRINTTNEKEKNIELSIIEEATATTSNTIIKISKSMKSKVGKIPRVVNNLAEGATETMKIKISSRIMIRK